MLIIGRNVVIALHRELFPFNLLENLTGQRRQQRRFVAGEAIESGRIIGPADIVVNLVHSLCDSLVHIRQTGPHVFGQIADHAFVDRVNR